ncbi:MAG TPA: hypothetical protein VK457_20410 [Chloroflexota bacterium]|nr:hypothetical protein [Chloroflexota bacterium]
MPANQPTMPNIAAISLDHIEIDPENVRTAYPQETIEQLRQALLAGLDSGEQFINPPSVYPIGNDRYRVKHGNCRVLAAQGVVDRLHVRIIDPPARRADKLLDQLGENLLQGGLDPIDTARALRHLRDTEELAISGIVDLLAQRGIKRGKFWVNMHLGLLRLHPFVEEAVRSSQIAPRTAWLLRGFSEAEQVRWARDIIAQGMTQRTVEDRLGLRPVNTNTDDVEDVIDAANPELAYLQIGERIEEAASRETLPARPRRQLDADRRAGAVDRRWELIATPLPESSQSNHQLQLLEQHEWSKRAATVQRDLAREFAFFGGCEPEKAISLAERASREAAVAPSLAAAANQLAQVGEQSRQLEPDSALVELLNLRLTRMANGQPISEELTARC